MVGDVKQSIYRFRLAEPRLFLKNMNASPPAVKKRTRIDLSRNFRSRKEILDATNFCLNKSWGRKSVKYIMMKGRVEIGRFLSDG